MSTGRVCMPLIVSHMPREEYAEALHARSRTGIEAGGVPQVHRIRLVPHSFATAGNPYKCIKRENMKPLRGKT